MYPGLQIPPAKIYQIQLKYKKPTFIEKGNVVLLENKHQKVNSSEASKVKRRRMYCSNGNSLPYAYL